MRVFLDANVLFSVAYKASGTSRRLWELSTPHTVTLVTSRLAIDEARRHLAVKKPIALSELRELLSEVEIIYWSAVPDPSWNLEQDDGTLLATAIACGVTHFITGDKHFRPLMSRDDLGIRVVTIREFLTLVQGEDNAS